MKNDDLFKMIIKQKFIVSLLILLKGKKVKKKKKTLKKF